MLKKSWIIFGLLLAVSVATSIYFFMKYKGASEELKKASGANNQEVVAILEKVGMLIDLPTDEEPTVATVTDKEKLKEQKFFAKAENDDKVIIFVKAQKAILYRPSTNKIIEVAKIDNIDQKIANEGTATVSAQPEIVKTDVVVLNGTTRVGLSNGLVQKFAESGSLFALLQRYNTKRSDYEKTLIVDLGVGEELTNKMQAIVGIGQIVKQMPEGESTPSSQLVVILGADYANVSN